MGGISVLVLFATMGALAIVFLAAAVLFLAATIVSVVFAARTKKRHAQGKRLKGLIAIPIALYAVSVPVLLFFSITVIIPACHDSTTTDYFDCSNAITRHDSASLERALDAPELQLPDDGPRSYRSLIQVGIAYGDVRCVEAVLEDAWEKGRPIDLNEPLDDYDSEGERVIESEYALISATSSDFSSLDMVRVLLEYGADVNVADACGRTPLHNACAGLCVDESGFADKSDEAILGLSEIDEAIDLLLSAGADISAEDQNGATPWDSYRSTVRSCVDAGALSSEDAVKVLSGRFEALEPVE